MENVTIEIFTSEIAKEILSRNKSNRNLNMRTARRYAEEMKSGKWINNTGESIKFDSQGNLRDGQHRLKGIIIANTSISFMVVRNIDDNAFVVLDSGKARNSKDVFDVQNIKNGNVIASMIKKYNLLKKGSVQSSGHSISLGLSNSRIWEIYNTDRLFWNSNSEYAIKCSKRFYDILPPAIIGAFYVLFAEISKEDAFKFIEELTDSYSENQSINILKNVLKSNKFDNRKLKSQVINVYIIKTWNAFRTKSDLKRLKHKLGFDIIPVAV
jgi:hypothetical protein